MPKKDPKNTQTGGTIPSDPRYDTEHAGIAPITECDEAPILEEAIRLVIENGNASTSFLQRKLKIGYGRTAALIDRMEELGIVGPADGTKPREVLLCGDRPTAVSDGSEASRRVPEALDFDFSLEDRTIAENVLPDGPEDASRPYEVFPIGFLAASYPARTGNGTEDPEDSKEPDCISVAAWLRAYGLTVQEVTSVRGPALSLFTVRLDASLSQTRRRDLADAMELSGAFPCGIRVLPFGRRPEILIEIPNRHKRAVPLREVLESDDFRNADGRLPICLGVYPNGAPAVSDLAALSHLLVAGATGAGKSVCISAILVSLLSKASPEELRLILVDTKRVEFSAYHDLPHLMIPIVTDPQRTVDALCAAVLEMEKRLELIERVGARDVDDYRRITAGDPDMPRLPYIVIVIDELSDLMGAVGNGIEAALLRLSEQARAAGIHLVIGTQRPSADVITGTVKVCIPSKIAFKVASLSNSRAILGCAGAERLCGRGDMLFLPTGSPAPRRLQGCYVGEEEIACAVRFLIDKHYAAEYDAQLAEMIELEAKRCASGGNPPAARIELPDEDPKLDGAVRIALFHGKISTSLLQRHLRIGYGRASRLLDRMEELGIVGPANSYHPRVTLVTAEQYAEMKKPNE